MIHNFDTEIATEYGINEAILLSNLYYWIEHNKANNQNYHDGYYWTFNSAKAFSELFPYMSIKQVTYALKKLKKEGLIITGNHNQSKYNRTTWYALTEKGYSICTKRQMDNNLLENGNNQNVKSICQNGEMDLTKGNNGFDKIDQSMTNNKPNNKPDSNTDIDGVCNSKDTSAQESSDQESTHTQKKPEEKYYEHLCQKYGKDFVDIRVKNGSQYNGITWKKIGEWCEQDWKRIHDTSRASPSNQFNNHARQQYDMDTLEEQLLNNT